MVVDDHQIVRHGIVALISRKPGLQVVAEARNGQEAITLFREHRPDVTLIDLNLPDLSGVDVITAVRKEFPDGRFVVLTTFDRDELIDQAFHAGAMAYALKSVADANELATMIERAHAGERHIPPEIARVLAERVFNPLLTARELDVMRLASRGASNKEIASSLAMAVGTVKTHMINIFEKLGVNDRRAATAEAIKRGLIRSPF